MQTFNPKILVVFILLLIQFQSTLLFSQDFEGEVLFAKETAKDTTFFAYKIKNNKVRVEELDKKKQVVNYMIVDIDKQKVLTINPKRKLYAEVSNRYIEQPKDTTEFIIYKTENYKRIDGYKCFQWRVRNKKNDTEFAFWVSNEIFCCFDSLLKLLNKDDKSTLYYLHIPSSKGFFPLSTVERSALREWREQIKLVNIENRALSPNQFEIPQGYRMFQKN